MENNLQELVIKMPKNQVNSLHFYRPEFNR